MSYPPFADWYEDDFLNAMGYNYGTGNLSARLDSHSLSMRDGKNMQKKIILCDQEVDYTLRISKRARRMRLTVFCDGRFVVTIPRRATTEEAENLIKRKADWVMRQFEEFKNFKGKIFPRNDKKSYLEHKAEALALVSGRIAYFNKYYNFKFNRISIRDQKARWGSCTSKKNLNFNYKLVFLPQELVDYLVVHELCHLGEFNHSQNFWDLIGKTLPNYRDIRKGLYDYRLGLN